MVEGAELGRLLGEVVAEVAAAALLALDRRARDGLRDGEQVAQVEAGVPAGVVLAVPGHADARRTLVERRDPGDRFAHLALGAHDADQVLHRLLQVGLHRVGVLGRAAAFERRQRLGHRPVDDGVVDRRLRVGLGVLGRVLAGPLAEHDQVRQRVAAEAVGAVDAGGALAGGEQPRHDRLLGVGVDADAAHDVVRGRADFHRLLGDVEVGQLLELVVHARQLALDVRLAVRAASP